MLSGDLKIKEQVDLAPLTTIHLGGPAAHLAACTSPPEIIEALNFARARQLPVHILGGGSNTIFLDAGFAGLVIRIDIRGIHWLKRGLVEVGAGEPWDDFVAAALARNLAGIECLSGIPGLVGATPIQNVGAYGQEIAETLVQVRAMNIDTQQIVEFNNKDVQFSYRHSRFKGIDANKYIITHIVLQLRRGGQPAVRYPELAKKLAQSEDKSPTLQNVRQAVLALRATKSMVVRASDPHSRSCGSFFTNPIVTAEQLAAVKARLNQADQLAMPVFPAGQDFKLSAAWLIERAGFTKGERRAGVGISPNHILALVNYGGTTEQVLGLAAEIEAAVQRKLGITLAREPIVVS